MVFFGKKGMAFHGIALGDSGDIALGSRIADQVGMRNPAI